MALSLAVSVSTTLVREVRADNNYFPLSPGNPLLQNWTDTSLITAAAVWNNIASINGYSGNDSAVSGTGIDPQTIVADYSGTLSVQANQAVPNTLATGGVAEFHIADPTVAIMGGGVTDFPYLDFRLDTSGCTNPSGVRVRYNIRDLDGSSDLAVSQVALHYRIGSTGNYTNIPAGYVADASDTGTATKVTPIAAMLPATALGQSQVHVRVMTTNSPGNDEWLGIDDIDIACVAPTAASVTVNGRVTDAFGRAVSRARISAYGVDGGQFIAYTNTFGYYRMTGLLAGSSYVISAKDRRLTFASQFVSLGDDLSDVNFVANPF